MDWTGCEFQPSFTIKISHGLYHRNIYLWPLKPHDTLPISSRINASILITMPLQPLSTTPPISPRRLCRPHNYTFMVLHRNCPLLSPPTRDSSPTKRERVKEPKMNMTVEPQEELCPRKEKVRGNGSVLKGWQFSLIT